MPMGHLPRRRPMGLDPNYRGGEYRGQRTGGRDDGAPYGRYRAEHDRELQGAGGYRGRATGAGMLRDPGPMRASGPVGGAPRSDVALRGRHDGGGSRYDRSFRGGRDGGYGDPGRGSGGRSSGPYRSGGGPRMMRSYRPPRYDGDFSRGGGARGGFGGGYSGSRR